MPCATKVDHEEIQELLTAIDNTDNKLSRGEIDFIAALIDQKVTEFTAEEADRVRTIHKKRVVNGKPDLD